MSERMDSPESSEPKPKAPITKRLRTIQADSRRSNRLAVTAQETSHQYVDFSRVKDNRQYPTGRWRDRGIKPLSPEGFRLDKKQIRMRQKRLQEGMENRSYLSTAEVDILYKKPIIEWDEEELARGRPRNRDGTFSGPQPKWVTAEMHEQAIERFTMIVRSGMRAATVDAIDVVKQILTNEDTDNRGKPVVAASTKLQAATFLIEHIVGKPTQRVESDVSVKLQGILGAVMVNPDEMGGGFSPAHFPGITMELAEVPREEEDEYGGE